MKCLRWEFGFTCSFCLLHESDFRVAGVRGSGLFSVEHKTLQSDDSDASREYANCFHACRFCNQTRKVAPITGPSGASLLDPVSDAWGEAFEAVGERLEPKDKMDPSALYTHEAYFLNDPRKQVLRGNRADRIGASMHMLGSSKSTLSRLFSCLERTGHAEIREGIFLIFEGIKLALDQLRDFVAVPQDAPPPGTCRCGRPGLLPSWLDRQTSEVA